MRDTGGHGGSTYAEMNVPLIVTGIKCESLVYGYVFYTYLKNIIFQ